MNSFRSFRAAVFAGALAVVWTNPVISEESDTDADIEEVIVTGSRIARSNTESTAPIKILDRFEIEKLGQTSIGDFLQDLPENVGGLNAQNNNGGNGSTQISLRGLGSSRTLVLVNGRRHVGYSTGGSVDLNAIAPNTIERIEVLNDGASTIYGSDAIAGVVNVITRRDFEGVSLAGYSGVSAESDGQISDINLTMGSSSDRGNVTVAIGHYEMNDVMAGNRGWSTQDRWYDWDQNNGYFEGLGSSATPEGTIIDRLGAAGNEAWDAVNPSGPYLWGPGGNNPSSVWSSFSFSGNSDVGEGSYYNYQPENYIYTPQERTNVFATGHYEIRDALTATMEISYINRKSDQLLAPTPLFIISEGLTIEAAQAHNPFGRDFIDVRRRMVEAGSRNFLQDISTYRLVGGLEYEINGWSLEASINYGRTDGTDTNQGRFIRSRVLEALSGTCADPCVPLNLFGGPGTISQDQIDYISYTGTAKTTQEQKTVQVNVSNNNIYELPAGNLGVAMGWEHRNERGSYVEDPLTEMGDTTGNKGESTRGSYEVDEAYIEFLAPVFDTEKLGVLDLEASVRGSDYSNFGRTSNSKYGFRWDFRDWLAFRTTVSEAFNAPSIASLFSGQFDSFPAAVDPCSSVVGQYGTNANVTANCDADGFVGGTTDPDTQLRARLGGNPNLGAETSDAFLFGFVIRPNFIENLDITIDSWEYEISNTIGSIGVGTILGGCYQADPNNRQYCDKIERNSVGRISNVYAATANIGEVETSGIDFQIDYRWDHEKAGSFAISWDYTQIDEFNIMTPGSDGVSTNVQTCLDIYDCGVTLSDRWILDVDWSKGAYDASIRVNSYSDFRECEDDYCNGGPDVASRNIEQVRYLTLSGGYDLGQGTRVRLVVSNLLDEDPPRIFNGFYSSADVTYDFMGRYLTLGVSHNF